MIKVSGTDNGKGVWMNAVGITTRGRLEVARIPRATLKRLVKVRDGEMGCVSVDVLRDIGENAGFYRLDRGVGMWVEPREARIEVPHEEDRYDLYGARLVEMYYKSGVRVDMRALRGVLDVAAIIGAQRCRLMARNGYWMLVNKEDECVVVKERDDALMVAYHELEMGDVYFDVSDLERVWGDVVAPPFDAPEWDINGNGRVCLWMGDNGGVRLGDVSGGGEIARGVEEIEGAASVRFLYAIPVALWMERYAVWRASAEVVTHGGWWKANPTADDVVRDGVLSLGLHMDE